MIVLFTDFGLTDPYVGQIHAILAQEASGKPVIDLFHAVPGFDIRAGAYLLPAYTQRFPAGTVFICVVDPGVGSARQPVMVRADGCWYVGPDNGLLHIMARRARECETYAIRWRPSQLSASFHGRDLFAPVAASLARGDMPDSTPTTLTMPEGPAWPDDLAQILYVDHYGNGITGLRASSLSRNQHLKIGDQILERARVFADVPPKTIFWYENANGLVEIAANQDSAAMRLGLQIGDSVIVV